jgi:hypothetical protein
VRKRDGRTKRHERELVGERKGTEKGTGKAGKKQRAGREQGRMDGTPESAQGPRNDKMRGAKISEPISLFLARPPAVCKLRLR